MKYYTVKQTAKKFGVIEYIVRQKIKSGELPYKKLKPSDRKHTIFIGEDVLNTITAQFFKKNKKKFDPDEIYETEEL